MRLYVIGESLPVRCFYIQCFVESVYIRQIQRAVLQTFVRASTSEDGPQQPILATCQHQGLKSGACGSAELNIAGNSCSATAKKLPRFS